MTLHIYLWQTRDRQTAPFRCTTAQHVAPQAAATVDTRMHGAICDQTDQRMDNNSRRVTNCRQSRRHQWGTETRTPNTNQTTTKQQRNKTTAKHDTHRIFLLSTFSEQFVSNKITINCCNYSETPNIGSQPQRTRITKKVAWGFVYR